MPPTEESSFRFFSSSLHLYTLATSSTRRHSTTKSSHCPSPTIMSCEQISSRKAMDVNENSSPVIKESPDALTASQAPNEGGSSKRKLTLVVWNHFKREKIDGKWKAICKYCNGKLLGELKQGTSHLHIWNK
ncbi:hypothetical protein CDL12_13437 [Handroanthus impetiginosus]|uniref:BED-type domain-containing protein n=1 Tax=Handroanthus impetiginosus TaxID=429701 RepID=A0A2G9H8Y8_9LAMI|nr:hypothetical protein CDL12_13437 [Handroanthus impetiginosus]